MKCKRRLRCDRLLNRRNSQGSCISVRLVAQAASCTLSDHPPCQCSPPPLATVEKQRMGSRWRKPGEPRKPKRMRPHNFAASRISLQAADLAGLRTPGLLILVLASYGTYRQRLPHFKAPGSKLQPSTHFIVSRPQFRPTTM